jgi:hypothetical protein
MKIDSGCGYASKYCVQTKPYHIRHKGLSLPPETKAGHDGGDLICVVVGLST